MTTASFTSSRPRKAAPRFRLWTPSRRSRAEFANAASSRRCPVKLSSSGITGWWWRTEIFEAGMNVVPTAPAAFELDRLLVELRPKLHRYCARMVGSAIDGEDVVQDALIKAVQSFAAAGADRKPGGRVFRVWPNNGLGFFRPRQRPGRPRSGGGGGM